MKVEIATGVADTKVLADRAWMLVSAAPRLLPFRGGDANTTKDLLMRLFDSRLNKSVTTRIE